MEHHSNLLPWQHAAKRAGAQLKFVECSKDGKITLEDVAAVLTEKDENYGNYPDVQRVRLCQRYQRHSQSLSQKGIVLVADGAQSVPHMPVNVSELDVDFLSFSGHKMLTPMGIGALYGKLEWLEKCLLS